MTTSTIRHGDHYDIDEWRLWLVDHAISISDVCSITFDGNSITVIKYLYEDGKKYVVDGEVATVSLEKPMQSAPPQWSHRIRWPRRVRSWLWRLWYDLR